MLTLKQFAQKWSQSIAKFKQSEAASVNQLQQNNESATAPAAALSIFKKTARLPAVFVFALCACHTLPKPEKTVTGNAGSAQGSWRAKALVKNLKSNKSVTLDLDIVAQEPDRLRIEALGPFSTHVASVAAKGDDVRIALTREKKFIESPADRYALARVVPVRVAPSDLLALLFDRPLESNNSGWKCDHSHDPEWSCQSGSASVARQSDDEGRRRFVFNAPDAEMNLVITEAHAGTPPGDSAYELYPPAGFHVEKRSR